MMPLGLQILVRRFTVIEKDVIVLFEANRQDVRKIKSECDAMPIFPSWRRGMLELMSMLFNSVNDTLYLR